MQVHQYYSKLVTKSQHDPQNQKVNEKTLNWRVKLPYPDKADPDEPDIEEIWLGTSKQGDCQI